MAQLEQIGSTPYLVDCYTCRTTFDASGATWCCCINENSSLVCPQCLRCFCWASFAYLREFWDNAPDSLWARKAYEISWKALEWSNPLPRELVRPAILLVDDDEHVVRIARHVIEALGLGLVIARDGREGVALASRYKPDIVITDTLMPRLDGLEMCLKIKKTTGLERLKVIVMSAVYRKHASLQKDLPSFEADGVLTKPIRIDELRRVLNQVMAS